MKKTVVLLVLMLGAVMAAAQTAAPDVPFYPRSVLRKIADSMAENCGICASDCRKMRQGSVGGLCRGHGA
jgi:uncharacterized Fe-S radical SAM superfamily protein PflX